MKQIFPKEIIESTIEAHQFQHSNRSKFIYAIILLALIIAFVLLPFITIDVYSSARGIIKPDQERLAVMSINSGRVIEANIKNNLFVEKGDTLLVLDNSIINEKLNLSSGQKEETKQIITDLDYLINTKQTNIKNLESSKYKKEYLFYQQKRQELQTRFKKLKHDYDRNKILHDKGVIAKVEFENIEFDYKLILSSIYQLRQQQINSWQASLTSYKSQLLETESTERQLIENKSQFVITAPISGSLINVKSIVQGSFLNAGEIFATISPNTELLVECYINPKDIGMLKTSITAKFQIDAFNYNQWGLASGKIIDISKDIEFLENASVFKVKCNINEKELLLKNGFQGKIKKGMTVNAQFKLTERSLFDLLYDKLDDWVNPSQNSIAINN